MNNEKLTLIKGGKCNENKSVKLTSDYPKKQLNFVFIVANNINSIEVNENREKIRRSFNKSAFGKYIAERENGNS